MITAGEGKYKVSLDKIKIGDDLLLVLQGGEKPHVGGAVVCEPQKEARVVRLGSHHDYVVLKPLAEQACEQYATTAVAVGGIHINNPSREEIDKIVENCEELKECI